MALGWEVIVHRGILLDERTALAQRLTCIERESPAILGSALLRAKSALRHLAEGTYAMKTTGSIKGALLTLGVVLSVAVTGQVQLAVSAPSVEIAVLKAQLETTRQFQDSFVSMGQWALGVAVVVALALVAFSWFSNKATYERHRQALRDKAASLRASMGDAMASQVKLAAAELDQTLAAREASIQAAAVSALQPKVIALSVKVRQIERGIRELKLSAELKDAAEAEASARDD